MEFWVEPSLENPPLAEAEVAGAVRALGGERRESVLGRPSAILAVDLPGVPAALQLAARLAMARRVMRPWEERAVADVRARFEVEGQSRTSASLRPLSRPRAPLASGLLDKFAQRFRAGGGRIDLDAPARRFFLALESDESVWVAEELAPVDRASFARRRMPTLPFRRPVSLPPKLGRVAVNLAAVRPSDRVVDPFVGTGALLLEAALLGARVTGGVRDAEMVKGAVRNFAHHHLEFDSLTSADAGDAASRVEGARFDALVTDPPYGRSSGSGGEEPAALLARILPRWGERLRPGARMVVVVPGGPDPVPPPWKRVVSVADRVHRSLTREFRVYERADRQ